MSLAIEAAARVRECAAAELDRGEVMRAELLRVVADAIENGRERYLLMVYDADLKEEELEAVRSLRRKHGYGWADNY